MRVASKWIIGKEGGSLAEAVWDFDQPGPAFGFKRESALKIEGLLAAGGGGEEMFEGHRACRVLVSPLSFSNGVGHPQGYAFVFDANMKFSS